MSKIQILSIFFAFVLSTSNIKAQEQNTTLKTSKRYIAVNHNPINSPNDALKELKNGNQRFLDGRQINTNYRQAIQATKNDQHPHSLILSCLDSRIPPEIIFDQGIGNLFVARVAGNIEDPNILGSMEFATKVMGTKLIVVMGHNKCGAVKGAIEDADLGNLTQLVMQIKPAITGNKTDIDAMMNETAKKNVALTIIDILKQSTIISQLVKEGKLKIAGAFYDLNTGKVTFND